jgi:hypothetical protein
MICRPSIRPALSLILLIASAAASQAQSPVYRCGLDGREYSSTPCPGGKPVAVDDARTAEQQRQASEAAQRDAKLAKQLEAERRQREAAAKPASAARIGSGPAASAPPVPASRPGHGKKPKKRKASRPVDPTMSDPIRVPAKPSR